MATGLKRQNLSHGYDSFVVQTSAGVIYDGTMAKLCRHTSSDVIQRRVGQSRGAAARIKNLRDRDAMPEPTPTHSSSKINATKVRDGL